MLVTGIVLHTVKVAVRLKNRSKHGSSGIHASTENGRVSVALNLWDDSSRKL